MVCWTVNVQLQGQRVKWYSVVCTICTVTSLRAVRPEDRIPAFVRVGPTQPPIHQVLGVLCRWQNGRGVMLPIHCYLIPRLTTSGAIPVLRLYAFMAWTVATSPFLQRTPYHDLSPKRPSNIGLLARQTGPNCEAPQRHYIAGWSHKLSVIIWTRFTGTRNVKNAFMGESTSAPARPFTERCGHVYCNCGGFKSSGIRRCVSHCRRFDES